MQKLFGALPEFYSSEMELRELWSDPRTRAALLQRLEEAGFDLDSLNMLRTLINAEDSDLFDVLEYISFEKPPITRQARVDNAGGSVFANLSDAQKEFIGFVLTRYVETGVQVLDQKVLPELLQLRYDEIADAAAALGGVDLIRTTFVDFQRHLYETDSKTSAS